jgi:hypothetical protein
MQGSAVLFSEMTPAVEWEVEFNDWYDQEHIPLRMGAPGFVSAQRYKSVENPLNYLAVYEMEGVSALSTPGYQEIKNNPSALTKRMLNGVSGFSRYICQETGVRRTRHEGPDPLNAPFLYTVAFEVPADAEAEFNDWYEQDHLPILLECRDWLLVRRFRVIDGQPHKWTHLAFHYLATRGALASPERERARRTPWREKLAQNPWFKPQPLVFMKYGTRQSAK